MASLPRRECIQKAADTTSIENTATTSTSLTPVPSGAFKDEKRNRRPQRQRRILSCLPCREHKVKCNRKSPCDECCRHGRENRCRQHPAPEAPRQIVQTLPLRQNGIIERGPTQTREPLVKETALLRAEQPLSLAPRPGSRLMLMRHIGDGPFRTSFLPFELDISGIARCRKMKVADIAREREHQVCTNSEAEEHWAQYWKITLAEMLPSRLLCDTLVEFYSEGIDWVYEVLHMPSFMAAYEAFWLLEVQEIDLHWLALLFSVLCTSAMTLPSGRCAKNGLEAEVVRYKASAWYFASRQALTSGNWEVKPSIVALQVVVVLQLYHTSGYTVEELHALLASAIRGAYALGLHRKSHSSNYLQREIRHRLWWAICDADTFQSITRQWPTMIPAHLSMVPRPLNCNDGDISDAAIHERPADEPTKMSVHINNARVYKVLSKLYTDNGRCYGSIEFIIGVEAEIRAIFDQFPWYMALKYHAKWRELPRHLEFIPWSFNLLHTFVSMQRIRMYRPFFRSDARAREATMVAASEALDVYRILRRNHIHRPRNFGNYGVCHQQVFAVAVTLAVLLLVEKPPNDARTLDIRRGIEIVITDLELISRDEQVPLALKESKVVAQILSMCDSPEPVKRTFLNGLVADLYTVVGGKFTTKEYLERDMGRTSEPQINGSENPGDPQLEPNQQPLQVFGSMDIGNDEFLNMSWGVDFLGLQPHIMVDQTSQEYFDWNWDSILPMGDDVQY